MPKRRRAPLQFMAIGSRNGNGACRAAPCSTSTTKPSGSRKRAAPAARLRVVFHLDAVMRGQPVEVRCFGRMQAEAYGSVIGTEFAHMHMMCSGGGTHVQRMLAAGRSVQTEVEQKVLHAIEVGDLIPHEGNVLHSHHERVS
ncbi:hypothetical protein L0U95_35955 (plasmid) [Burkholderia cenocepacia]|uniref:hypothetical protein n=1 Tax=Burkholderia cenocepacia TaxID=95486 RepID=UPI001F469E0A|nr:hypothetical protein [Burkholderia cenocepacia]UJH78818.1 hypothetical protein L0U95_35955 [Burkholderia cenocepacia]